VGRETCRVSSSIWPSAFGQGLDLLDTGYQEGTIGLSGPLKNIDPPVVIAFSDLCLLVDSSG